MARPSKYNEQTINLLKQYIRDGFTIKQACYGADISEDTFSRWRKKYPKFNEAVNEATNRQWGSSLALAKYGCRTYKRPSRTPKPLQDAPRSSQEAFPSVQFFIHSDGIENGKFHGLPIRYMTMDVEKLDIYYYDPSSRFVFWKDKQGIVHTMRYETYERKINPNREYFLGEIL